MSDTPQVLLAHHLKALRLPTFLCEYDKLARRRARETCGWLRRFPKCQFPDCPQTGWVEPNAGMKAATNRISPAVGANYNSPHTAAGAAVSA